MQLYSRGKAGITEPGSGSESEIVVLDTTALYAGILHDYGRLDRFVTTEEVLDEAPRRRGLEDLVEDVLSRDIVRVEQPSAQGLEEAMKAAEETGDSAKLSRADLSIIALSLDLRRRGLKPVILTDDLSVQNAASRLGLGYRSILTRGIRRAGRWRFYCPGCGKSYRSGRTERCSVCGTRLKRRLR